MTSLSRINPFTDPRLAAQYDPWYADRLGATMDRLQKQLVLRMAAPCPGECALDVGTGTGNYACTLARRGLQVIGVDPSAAMLGIARRKAEPVTWQLGAAENLPYRDASFPLVISVTALEFVRDVGQALAEMYRVLKPGGRLVVGTLNARGPWGEFYGRLALDPASPFHHARLLTAEAFTQELGRLGTVSWSSAGFVPPSGRGLRVASILERWGRTFCRSQGALLVGRVNK